MTAPRFLRPALAACLLSASLPLEGNAAAATTPSPLTLDAIFAPGGAGRSATQLAWSPDGQRLTYLWKDEHGEALWWLDLATGKSEPLFRLDDWKGRWDDKPTFALDAHQWLPRGDSLLLTSGGDLFRFSLGRHEVYRLTEKEKVEDPKLSPQGDRVAFVRDADLYLLDLATRRETALTSGGKKDVTLNGVVDWVYGEEIWTRAPTAYWWSPDGRSIAYLQFDETPVEAYPIVDYSPKYPAVTWQKYPKAGEPNPKVRIGVVDVATGKTSWLATGESGGKEGDYLARVAWTPDGKELRVQRLNRDQNRLDLLRCRPEDGHCTALHTEEHKTWIDLTNDFRPLPDGRFLWSSAKSGWRRLYLHAADGKEVRPLTPEGWTLTALDALTADGWAYVTGHSTASLGATDRQVLRVRIDGGTVEKVAAEPGTNGALVAEKSGASVLTWSDAEHPPVETVHRADGTLVATLPEAPPPFDLAALPHWELLTVDGPEGTKLPARLLKPAGLDPAHPDRKYPVIFYHYGAPSSQGVVNNAWGRGRDLWHKWMATRGYAVFEVENRASIFFGQEGADRNYRRMGHNDLEAQLAGVAYLKTLPWVDPSRLGLWGWSGGGANTLYCLFNAPGVWKAGVSGAPVTDWALYDTIWTERYLDRPADNPEGYRLSSPLSFAGNLKDALLLLHGTADDNVHPQNTIVLTDKLIQAKLPFEEALYPHQKHGFKEEVSGHLYHRIAEFFDRHLKDEVVVERVEVK
ncbi:MAG TPA: DPP IV N-terminal domain-containing protein [Thermoanaerobaculia bacterium]|nr:DPP IV N-terminal domain-containing protein [Thermoanaerobaculia bacterium]